MSDEQTKTRSGFVALIGRPNVGKSTLLNAILGEKLAIVSPRPQTTRNRILGVLTRDNVQLTLLDTPGIHRRRNTINRYMVQQAIDALADVDLVVLVTEVSPKHLPDIPASSSSLPAAASLHPEDGYVLEQIKQHNPSAPILVVINKVDLVKDPAALLPLIERWQKQGYDDIVPISALKENGVERVLDEMCSRLPVGEHLYPEDMLTDRAERFLVAELIREQVFLQCQQEIPYATAIDVERFEERAERSEILIQARIYVERDGQKAIVIGQRGARIKEVGSKAREEISRLLGCNVHLLLEVQVARDWTRVPGQRRRFGYE
jgi:GTP-binding protein Era